MQAKARMWTVVLTGGLLLAAAGTLSAAGMMGMHGMMMGEGDAKVSKEEYLKHAEARFTRMDVNKDGVIDATDRAATRKRMHDCMGMMHGTEGGGMNKMDGGAQSGAADQEHESHHPQP